MSRAFELEGLVNVDVKDAVNNLKKVNSEVDGAGNTTNSFMDKVKNVGKVVAGAFAVKAVVDFGKSCIEAAGALDVVQRKTNVIFGDMTKDVEDWAMANERTFGLGAGTIQGFANNIADLTQGMGMAKDESWQLSQGATELGVQLANWNGIDAGTAVDDITRAMTGSTEAVAKYGIKLNENVLTQTAMNMGLGDNFQALDEATKAQVRYKAILDASGNAIDYWEEGNRSMSFSINEAKEQFGNITESIGMLFLPMAQRVLDKIADLMAKFAGWVADMTAKWETVGKPIIEGIKTKFDEMGLTTGNIIEFIKLYWSAMMEYFSTLWETVGKPVFDFIMLVIGLVRDAFAERMPQIQEFFSNFIMDAQNLWENYLKPCFEAIGNFITNVLAPTFEFVFKNIIMPVVDSVFHGIGNLWNNSLKPIFQGIISFITGVFSGDWKKAWNGVVDTLGGIFSGISTVVKAPLNAVIGLINKAISGLNSISVSIPDWIPGIGGKSFGVNIPQMNYLENGGILTQPTLLNSNVMAGEKNKGQSAQSEAVIPLDRLENWIKELSSRAVKVIVNGKEMMTAVAEDADVINGRRLMLTNRGVLV